MNALPDHPDFTALALGEQLHGAPAQALLDVLRTSMAARREAEAIHATGEALAAALKAEPALTMGAERHHGIFRADLAAVRARFAAEDAAAPAPAFSPAVPRRRGAWLMPAAAAAAVAAALIIAAEKIPAGKENPVSPLATTEPTGELRVNRSPAQTPGVKTAPMPSPMVDPNQTARTVPPAPPLPAPPPKIIVNETRPPVPPPRPDLPLPAPPGDVTPADDHNYVSPPDVRRKGK